MLEDMPRQCLTQQVNREFGFPRQLPARLARRDWIRSLAGLALTGGLAASEVVPKPRATAVRRPGVGLKVGLNAYSFDKLLRSQQMSLLDLVDYCAEHEIHGLDATGYYFPGHPAPPADSQVFELKRKAFVNGVQVFGTGVRNDFAVADAAARARDLGLVKSWIPVAAKLGAGVLRVFSGRELPKGYTFDQVLEWLVPLFRECAAWGQAHGVMIGLQHHDDLLKTAEQTIRVVEAVASDWFAVILDVGSLRTRDVYEEIERLVPYAVSWQLKATVWQGDQPVPIDLKRVRAIIERAGFRGYLSLEPLGLSDPREGVARFRQRVRDEIGV